METLSRQVIYITIFISISDIKERERERERERYYRSTCQIYKNKIGVKLRKRDRNTCNSYNVASSKSDRTYTYSEAELFPNNIIL